MVCQSCGVNAPEGESFCPACGKRISDFAMASASPEQTAEITEKETEASTEIADTIPENRTAQPDATVDNNEEIKTDAPPHGLKLKKRLLIPAAGALALVLCAGLILLSVHNGKQRRYNEGVTLLEAGKYAEAQIVFAGLKKFDDSPLLEDYSANMVRYTAALALVDSEKYQDAADAFAALGDFQDAPEQVKRCQNELTYINALDLYTAGDFQGAKDIFSSLGAFSDAIAKADECDRILRTAEADALYERGNFEAALIIYRSLLLGGLDPLIEGKILDCHTALTYIEAEAFYTSGDYYDAYTRYAGISYFKDAEARAKDCIQPFPETGEVYHNEDYKTNSCSLAIRTPDDEISKSYIKIYSLKNDLVSAVAIGSNTQAKIWLPAGEYCIKYAYGDNWFGPDDLFGDEGTYSVLNSGLENSVLFKLESSFYYTLSLRTGNSSDNNVNVENEDRNSF
ncbi:MAG: hypothetical protein LLF75_10630 [Eubacteriales bacterium]|nr:hypothetical protein [Eubacteriales bacterium]